jgi:hypothetical protein
MAACAIAARQALGVKKLSRMPDGTNFKVCLANRMLQTSALAGEACPRALPLQEQVARRTVGRPSSSAPRAPRQHVSRGFPGFGQRRARRAPGARRRRSPASFAASNDGSCRTRSLQCRSSAPRAATRCDPSASQTLAFRQDFSRARGSGRAPAHALRCKSLTQLATLFLQVSHLDVKPRNTDVTTLSGEARHPRLGSNPSEPSAANLESSPDLWILTQARGACTANRALAQGACRDASWRHAVHRGERMRALQGRATGSG